jgi:hypothetical protein
MTDFLDNNVAAVSDMTVHPGSDQLDSQDVLLQHAELIIGAALDDKGSSARKGMVATFGPLNIPKPDPPGSVIVTRAKLTLVPSRTMVKPPNSTGYKLCSMERDGGWDGIGPTIGSFSSATVPNTLWRQERIISMRIGDLATPGGVTDSTPPFSIANARVCMLGEDTPNAPPRYSTGAGGTGRVLAYFRCNSGTVPFDKLSTYVHFVNASGVPPGFKSVQITVYRIPTTNSNPQEELGPFGGAYDPVADVKCTSAMRLSLVGGAPGNFETFSLVGDTSPGVEGDTYMVEYVLPDLPDEDVVFFEGHIQAIDFPTYSGFGLVFARTRTRYATQKGYLGNPAYFHASMTPAGWLDQDETDDDTTLVRLRRDSTTPLVNTTLNVPIVIGNSGYAPDITLDVAALIQEWVDAPWYTPGEMFCLSMISLGIDSTATEEWQAFHSIDNLVGQNGPTLTFDYSIIDGVAGCVHALTDVQTIVNTATALKATVENMRGVYQIVEASAKIEHIVNSNAEVTPTVKIASLEICDV